MEACDLLSVELQLDEIEALLASELPPHMRAFARAHARGEALPPAPDVLYRQATLATAREALAHPLLAERGLALLRLVAPLAIEADPGVAAARAADPTWDTLAALAKARNAAAAVQFGHDAIEVLHHLHGTFIDAASDLPAAPPVLPPPVAAWSEPDGITLDNAAISQVWDAIRARHGVTGAVRFEGTQGARPRTFVVQPRGEVVVVIPAQITTPAQRFAVLHELGHVLAALALPAGIPRVVDEAAAAYLARAIERPGEAEHVWYSAAAGLARVRRILLARVLDHIERRIAHTSVSIADRPSERPPWALWHDPGAQAAYVAAEAMADVIERDLGTSPDPGALVAALTNQREQIDRLGATIW
ncbi:MAG TPA: hypothetical protein VHN14_26785 [Kofleriaceae bacterium]|jgi:hypothetical protein|nr:hypothetical protein [Kofleriaceae bacterium]